MKNSTTFYRDRFAVAMLLVLLWGSAESSEAVPPPVTIPPLTDFCAELDAVRKTGRPLLLIFSAEHCFFCERLKENIIKPMLRSGDYDDRVMIRVTELDGHETIACVDGQPLAASELASRYEVRVTPTVLILGPDGKELAPRQLGINNEDYYGAYLDEAIAQAIETLRAKAEGSRKSD